MRNTDVSAQKTASTFALRCRFIITPYFHADRGEALGWMIGCPATVKGEEKDIRAGNESIFVPPFLEGDDG
jgi:hypothetical protein